MADIELVIKIHEEGYKKAQEIPNAQWDAVWLGIKHGTLLPKGHGRLIDADEFKEYIEAGIEIAFIQAPWHAKDVEKLADGIIKDIDEQPTIIEADREGKEPEI